MKQIRTRLTYANVMSSIAVFLVLGGATALAAHHLGKNSVGTKQLKKNAVTTAKIKKNAVNGAKIKAGSVNGAKLASGAVSTDKVADSAVTAGKLANGSVGSDKLANNSVNSDKIANGSVTGAKINAGSTSFSQVVERLRGTSSIPFGSSQVYPFNNATYIQPTGRDDQYLAAFDVTFAASCTQPRSAVALLAEDAANPGAPAPPEIIGYGLVTDKGTGEVTRRVNFGPYTIPSYGMSNIAPISPTNHTFSILLAGSSCNTGSGVNAVGAELDVIGTPAG